MSKRLKIALLIESSRASGRGLLHGIAVYRRTRDNWAVFYHERALHDASEPSLADWKPDGIIVRAESRRFIQQIAAMNIPTVDVLGWHPMQGIPAFGNDRRQVVHLALHDFLERGFRHLAYCGFPELEYSRNRGEVFAHLAEQAGCKLHLFPVQRRTRTLDTAKIEASGWLQTEAIATWLATLPKPVGLLACNDIRAQQVLAACSSHGICVPDDVAVMGVDNDVLLCEFCDPPLSSVALNNEKIGFEAAKTLEAMIAGEKISAKKRLVAPLGVVTRPSTDLLAIADPDVVAALRYIRNHIGEGITAGDVLKNAAVSASTLHRRFMELFGHSLKGEILKVRLRRVKELLLMTRLPLAEIAGLTGYAHLETMCKQFKKSTGLTPGEFRNSNQAAGQFPETKLA